MHVCARGLKMKFHYGQFQFNVYILRRSMVDIGQYELKFHAIGMMTT